MISISVPATSANLGPGFDCLGMAIDMHNIIEVEEVEEGLHIEVPLSERAMIPTDESNLIYSSMVTLFNKVGYKVGGLRIRQINNIPIAMGLGSSAACIVGGIVAANYIAGKPLDLQDMIELSAALDGHPDNVLPALVGGITVGCIDNGKVYYSRLEPPKGACIALIIPKFELLTKRSRAVLPKEIPFEDCVFNVGRAALLIASLLDGNMDNLAIAMEDRMHQPYRQKLIPHFDSVVDMAKESGAKGVFLSGAGPVIIAIVEDKDKCAFQKNMNGFLQKLDGSWDLEWTNINNNGVKIKEI